MIPHGLLAGLALASFTVGACLSALYFLRREERAKDRHNRKVIELAFQCARECHEAERRGYGLAILEAAHGQVHVLPPVDVRALIRTRCN